MCTRDSICSNRLSHSHGRCLAGVVYENEFSVLCFHRGRKYTLCLVFGVSIAFMISLIRISAISQCAIHIRMLRLRSREMYWLECFIRLSDIVHEREHIVTNGEERDSTAIMVFTWLHWFLDRYIHILPEVIGAIGVLLLYEQSDKYHLRRAF